jgi:hypothetical protein
MRVKQLGNLLRRVKDLEARIGRSGDRE